MSTALIKLGGSVITNKHRELSFSPSVARQLARDISKYLERGGRRVAIVHGGGSFGHVKAGRYGLTGGLNGGAAERRRKLRGFAEVRSDMRRLNGKMVEILLSEGIPAVSVPAESIVRISSDSVTSESFGVVDAALAHGLVPVTFGDAVFDDVKSFTILSGDVLMRSLGSHLSPDVSVFCTDVDGVYNTNPRGNKQAKLLEVLRSSTEVSAEGNATFDVTGEMRGKLRVLFEIASCSGRTLVVNGRRKGVLYSALSGGRGRWTTVVGD